MARRKKNPGIGTLVGIAVVGGLGYLVYNEVKADKVEKAAKKAKKHTVDLGKADAPSSVAMKVGETVRFLVPRKDPWRTEYFTEATAGEPVIVMAAKPDVNGSEVLTATAHAKGTVRVDFLYQPPPGSPDQATSAGGVDLVIT